MRLSPLALELREIVNFRVACLHLRQYYLGNSNSPFGGLVFFLKVVRRFNGLAATIDSPSGNS